MYKFRRGLGTKIELEGGCESIQGKSIRVPLSWGGVEWSLLLAKERMFGDNLNILTLCSQSLASKEDESTVNISKSLSSFSPDSIVSLSQLILETCSVTHVFECFFFFSYLIRTMYQVLIFSLCYHGSCACVLCIVTFSPSKVSQEHIAVMC